MSDAVREARLRAWLATEAPSIVPASLFETIGAIEAGAVPLPRHAWATRAAIGAFLGRAVAVFALFAVGLGTGYWGATSFLPHAGTAIPPRQLELRVEELPGAPGWRAVAPIAGPVLARPDGGFLTFADAGSGAPVVAESDDGVVWTAIAAIGVPAWPSVIAWNGTTYLLLEWDGTTAWVSPDGRTWTEHPIATPAFRPQIVVGGHGRFVATDYLHVWTSADGVAWTQARIDGVATGDPAATQTPTPTPDDQVSSVVFGPGGFVLAAASPTGDGSARVWSSDDGTSWRPAQLAIPADVRLAQVSLAANDAGYVLLGTTASPFGDVAEAGTAYVGSSLDGRSWSMRQVTDPNLFAWPGGAQLIVLDDGRVLALGNRSGTDLNAHARLLRLDGDGGWTTLLDRPAMALWRVATDGARVLGAVGYPVGRRWATGFASADARTIEEATR